MCELHCPCCESRSSGAALGPCPALLCVEFEFVLGDGVDIVGGLIGSADEGEGFSSRQVGKRGELHFWAVLRHGVGKVLYTAGEGRCWLAAAYPVGHVEVNGDCAMLR